MTHIGEVVTANNGQRMTLIAYRKDSDIDVQFEDSTIVTNKQYSHFKVGKIANPNYTPRLFEKNIANNGISMQIVAYRSSTDIDVQFEDGTTVYNKKYCDFIKGNIGHPISKHVGNIYGSWRVLTHDRTTNHGSAECIYCHVKKNFNQITGLASRKSKHNCNSNSTILVSKESNIEIGDVFTDKFGNPCKVVAINGNKATLEFVGGLQKEFLKRSIKDGIRLWTEAYCIINKYPIGSLVEDSIGNKAEVVDLDIPTLSIIFKYNNELIKLEYKYITRCKKTFKFRNKGKKDCSKYKLGDILYDITGLPCNLVDISAKKFTVEHDGKTRTFSKTSISNFKFYSARYIASLKVGTSVVSKDGYTALIKDYINNSYLLYFEDDDSEFLESTTNVNSGNFFKNTVYGRVGQKYKREDNSYWNVIEVLDKDSYRVSGTNGVELVTRKELKAGKKEEKTTIECRYEYNGSYFKDLPSLLRSLNRIDEVEKIRAILKRHPHLSIYEVLDRSKEVSRGKKVSYNGVDYDSIVSFCDDFDLSVGTLYKYIKRYGSFESGVKHYLDYKNTISMTDLCNMHGINSKNFIAYRLKNKDRFSNLSVLEQLELYKNRDINSNSLRKKCLRFGLNPVTVIGFYYKYNNLVSRDSCINLYRAREKFEFSRRITDADNFIYNRDFYFTCKCKKCGVKDILSTKQMLEHNC